MVKPTFNKNKAGEIISARIRVCDGYNLDGTKRTRSRTLKKPLGMSDAKFTKLAQEETLKDEMRYKEGYELDKRKTFAEYAAYVMDCKASSGVKRSTLERYASLLRRINAGAGNSRKPPLPLAPESHGRPFPAFARGMQPLWKMR